MALKASDYPRERYEGYFEVFDPRSMLAAQISKLNGADAKTLRAKADLLEKLEGMTLDTVGVRVYGKAPPTGVKGLAKEFSHVVVAEYEGDAASVETVTRKEMAKLKIGA